MANTKSAAKRARQITRRTRSNARVLTSVKTQLQAIRAAVAAGKTAEVRAMMPKVVSVLDKANRHKSELAASVASLK